VKPQRKTKYNRRMTRDEIARIVDDVRPARIIAAEMGLATHTVSSLRTRVGNHPRHLSSLVGQRRCTVQDIKTIYNDRESYAKDLAAVYGVSLSTINKIRAGRLYADVTGARRA